MKKHIALSLAAFAAISAASEPSATATTATLTQLTVTVAETEMPPTPPAERTVRLVVNPGASPDVQPHVDTLASVFAENLSKNGFKVRKSCGPADAGADAAGVVTASILEFHDNAFGNPVQRHQFSVKVAMSLADVQTGDDVGTETVEMYSPRKYTNGQVEHNRAKYIEELLSTAAAECTRKFAGSPDVVRWTPTPSPPPPPPSPEPGDSRLSIPEFDRAVKALVHGMRESGVFKTNYAAARSRLEKTPLVIVGGFADLTYGKSSPQGMDDLLEPAAQKLRILIMDTELFEAKDDALVTEMSKRIIENGNNPLEDVTLMDELKQHGTPDFYFVGDVTCFTDAGRPLYRIHLALHNFHTGKIIWEDVCDVRK